MIKFLGSLAQKDHLSFSFSEIIKKLACLILIVICIGLPITSVLNFLILFMSGLILVNSRVKGSFRRVGFLLMLSIAIFFIKLSLPHPALQEGHNIFYLTEEGAGPLEKELPPKVYGFMKQQYLERYPEVKRISSKVETGGWKSPGPKTLFAFSADSMLSLPKYSRIVDSINFSNLTEFRGGFVNSLDYNWYGNFYIKRDSMPFFVMYELSSSSVGSSLCWTGYLFWEGPGKDYRLIYNKSRGCRKIESSDIGRKVFGIGIYQKGQMGFVKWFGLLKTKIRSFLAGKKTVSSLEESVEPFLSMRLILSPFLRFFAVFKLLLEILGVFFILRSMVTIDRKRFIIACLLIVIATAAAYMYCPQLFGQYFIHEGGEDGLTHETFGRKILSDLFSGNWLQAIHGGEDVFWNTPGFRYYRALEKLFFGDTNFGYLAIVLILPYVLYGFFAYFISKRWSFWVAVIFLLGFLVNLREQKDLCFTYWIYVLVVRGGWPDTLAYTAFLGGLTLAFRYMDSRDNAYLWYGSLAHFLFFVTVFMRPQFFPTMLIAVSYFAFRLFKAGRFREVFITWIAFLPVVFPLIHNYFFGGKICLFTGAVDLAFGTPPSLYFKAFGEMLAGNLSGGNIEKVSTHLKTMFNSWCRLPFLALTVYFAFFKRKVPSGMRLIAILCLSMHFVNLFIFAVFFRYVYLAWALTVVVAIFLAWLLLKDRFSFSIKPAQ